MAGDFPNGADTPEARRDAGLIETALFAALRTTPAEQANDHDAAQALKYLQTRNLIDCFLSPAAPSADSNRFTQQQRDIAWRAAQNLAAAPGGFDALKRISVAPEGGFNEEKSLNLRLCLQACAAILEHAAADVPLSPQPQKLMAPDLAASATGQVGRSALAIKALHAAVHQLRGATSGEAAAPHANDWAQQGAAQWIFR